MQRQQDRSQHFLRHEQVPQVGAAEIAIGRVDAFHQGRRVPFMASVSHFDFAAIGKRCCIAAVAGRHHAVEHVDATPD